MTQFEQNVTVGFVLEEMFVLTNILVLEGSVDFDFRFQLQMTRARIECDVRNVMDCLVERSVGASFDLPFGELLP